MNIVACYKIVPDDEDVRVGADGAIDLSKAHWKVGTYDLNGIEAGVRLAEETGGSVKALTAAGAEAAGSKMKKAVLSRGPAEQIVVSDEGLADADSLAVAKALAAAIAKLGEVDVVLFGEGSGDRYSQQVGVLTGALLGWNTLNAVSALEPVEGGVRVTRTLEASVEVVDVPLPAALSVTSDINKPRIAGMKDILAAGKKPQTVMAADELCVTFEGVVAVDAIEAPAAHVRSQRIVEGEDEDALREFVELIKPVL